MDLTPFIRNIPDFPKKGILFKDITPLLNNPKATSVCVERLLEKLNGVKIDRVVGIEARGFFFATLLAQKLDVGFVPIRKPGKLPYNTISETYNLEYGSDTLQMHSDAIFAGENILLHDDVLATGGTAAAACKLIEQLGGNVVQCSFLMELHFLNGRKKLGKHPVSALLEF